MEATTDAIHAAVAEYNACRLSLLCGKASTTDVMYAGQAPLCATNDQNVLQGSSSTTMRHEEGCNALLQHVFHFPLQPAPRCQACQDVALCQQVHVLQAWRARVVQRCVSRVCTKDIIL